MVITDQKLFDNNKARSGWTGMYAYTNW